MNVLGMTTQLSGITQQHLLANKDEEMNKGQNGDHIKTDYIFTFIIYSHVYYKTFNQLVQIKDLKQYHLHTFIHQLTDLYENLTQTNYKIY